MSALRISRPGYETVLIPVDDGITPRVITPYIRGGQIESVRPRHKFGDGPARPGNNPAREPDRRPRCGEMMRLAGVTCGRRAGHRDNHSTPEAVERNRLRKRSYYVANFG